MAHYVILPSVRCPLGSSVLLGASSRCWLMPSPKGSAPLPGGKGAGLILPPLGVIDGSVLMLSAQLLVLCATLLGVEGYYEKMKEILKK